MIGYLKKELIYFCTALMFFTRIPIPFQLPYSSEIMNRSQKYYSWTGLIVGGIYALTFFLFQFVFGNPIAVIFAIIAGVLLTGAFHEDGFTDVCDAFGGGYGKEKILSIMKDSRIGAYGTVGISLLLLLKFVVLVQIADHNIYLVLFAMILANTASRFMAVTTVYTHQYVRDTADSKAKPVADKALSVFALIMGGTAVLIPFLFFPAWKFLLVLPLAYAAKMGLAAYFKKHIGGYTGDCLGAIQQVSELTIYLGILIVWSFI
ncbi:MAG: adenosylcobinamide-GDP ribazoletransferase [Flavobacteriia bacterium]|nr:adenosylcobinamide-GDP ribazoletransferase [Flavobacteriia bacterium]OJX37195.1 MAG: adenosylcobinamide-GDP ribazoletransferase [Flavobacteriia bacterium 40-80]